MSSLREQRRKWFEGYRKQALRTVGRTARDHQRTPPLAELPERAPGITTRTRLGPR